MKAIVTVIGKDKTGIIAEVSSTLSKMNVNIEDISQTIMQDYFVMMMMTELRTVNLEKTRTELDALGKKIGVDIRIQHEDIFNTMHRI